MSHKAPWLFPEHSQMWTRETILAGPIRSYKVLQFPSRVFKPGSWCKVQILYLEPLYCRLSNTCMYVVLAGTIDSLICSPLSLSLHTYTHTHTARNECIISTNPLRTPCVNGWCIDGVNSYYCSCNQGFQGLNCDEPGIIFSQCVHACMHAW